MSVSVSREGPLFVVELDRADRKNAVDRQTAANLADAFRDFDRDDDASVGILTGKGGVFCAGADLKKISKGDLNRLSPEGDGPMGPTRECLSKPTIAAIEGPAVAGGLELALWCDLRVCGQSAHLGVTCRKWGVPLIDGGTVRLPRLIGMSPALDMILTGRDVPADEAKAMGLVNRVAQDGSALETAKKMGRKIAAFPQTCLRNDRRSVYEQADMSLREAIANEFELGMKTIDEAGLDGVSNFVEKDEPQDS